MIASRTHPARRPAKDCLPRFRDNPVRDQTVYGNLAHLFSNTWTSETVVDFGRRTFNLNPVGAGFEPALNIPDLLSSGGFVGSVHFYREQHFQIAENLTHVHGNHTFQIWRQLRAGVDQCARHAVQPRAWRVFSPRASSACGTPIRHAAGFHFPRAGVSFWHANSASEHCLSKLDFMPALRRSAVSTTARRSVSSTRCTRFTDRTNGTCGPNLTLTLGLRYDVDAMPSAQQLRLKGGASPTNYGNVQPRVGFAYSLRGGKTVVRGGVWIVHRTV